MKTDFTINVQVSLGLTQELAALAGAFMAQTPAQSITLAEDAVSAPAVEPQTLNVADTTGKGKAEEPQAEESQPQQKPKALTTEDVRAAMHRARRRIEGEDYKDNADSEGYKKYHKELTSQFLNIAASLGCDKPSALPEESRGSFIAQCDELDVLEDGRVGVVLPF